MSVSQKVLMGLAVATAAVTLSPLVASQQAQAAPPKEACGLVYGGNIVSYAMTCSQPGQPMIGGFATWRNVPVTFDAVNTAGKTVQVSNYLRLTPNTEASPFENNIEIGLYAEKTGRTTQSYGPRWTEMGSTGGKTKAITAGVNPTKPDRRNHTYMLLRKDTGDQWDVLYDFNTVGSTKEQLKVPRGIPNRIDIGVEMMGGRYIKLPEIANRMQFMDENRTWLRVLTKNTAKVVTLPACSATVKPPNCFKTKLTDKKSFAQWSVSKPRTATTAAPTGQAPAGTGTAWGTGVRVPAVLNGVDQAALQSCLGQDPEACLSSVPGLAECVRTIGVCNAAGLTQRPQQQARPTAASPVPAEPAESIRQRAATAFGVSEGQVAVTSGPAARQLSAVDGGTWVARSSATTAGLERRGLRFEGFQATYAASTGQLLEACWGRLCDDTTSTPPAFQ
ncbi:hypothetical protein [Streptomyces jumonjinensis]|nr:hypothetical protein [Streptomyces jumonjinensis]